MPIIAPSASKHGVGDEDIMHAYRNPLRVWQLDEGLIMVIGPDRSGGLLEIGHVRSHEDVVIVHAMAARTKFLR